MRPNLVPQALALTLVLGALPAARADIIGGVNFPGGVSSFADQVVSYSPAGAAVTDPHKGAFNALGVPDYAGGNACANQAGCSFVSLGSGGSLVLRFTDNLLTGSGDNGLDLWIFEVGPDVEDTFVDISDDGITWHAVGKVFGATSGIDIDAFGFGIGSTFGYVRLTDDPNEGGSTGGTAGADIDAVGAISTIRQTVDAPPTLALALAALGVMAGFRRSAPRSLRR